MSIVGRFALAIVCGGAVSRPAFAQQSIDSIRGVKWRSTAIDEAADQFAVTFETQGMSYAAAAASLQSFGFGTVMLRVANLDELPSGTTTAQRDAEVVTVLTQLKAQGLRAYVWKREWLQRSGVIISYANPYTEAGADTFIADMGDIVNRAVAAGVDSALEGVAVVETNLENCDEVLERTLYIAQGINATTGNWLTTHTLMMPGAGMGCYFKGIGDGGSEWLTEVKAQTGKFAFIYKHMESQATSVCTLGSLNPEWESNVGFNATTTVDQQIAFLRDTMGLSDLESYVGYWAQNGFPDHANVVFWGDLDDGVSALSASYLGVEALHKLLVEINHWHGYFLDFAFGLEGATGQDLWRYLITVDPTNGYAQAENLAMNRSNTYPVWVEWGDWASEVALVGPTIVLQPASVAVAAGQTAVFCSAATGTGPMSYQWYLNGTVIPGATDEYLLVSAAATGSYACAATDANAFTSLSSSATLTLSASADLGRLTNVSVRTNCGTGSANIIAGFVIGGSGTDGSSKELLIRADGPELGSDFGVPGFLPDPSLDVFNTSGSSPASVGQNTGWCVTQTNENNVVAAGSAVYAFPLTTNSASSAIVLTLPSDEYTENVTGASNDTGIALAEVYDVSNATETYSPTIPRLVNVSARANVAPGAGNLIAGFTIGGSTDKTVLVRGTGSGLAEFGLTGLLDQPTLAVYSTSGGADTLMATNTGWGGDPVLASAASSVYAFAQTSSADCALLVTLPPGTYTANLNSGDGTSGLALVEVYDVP